MTTHARRFRLAAGVGALAVLVAVVIGVALTAPVPGSPRVADYSAEPTPSERPSVTPLAEGADDERVSTPGAEPAPPTASDAPSTAQDAPPEPASEIPPVSDGSAASGPGLPPSTPIPALLTGPAPESATAEDKVVAGFPAGIPVAQRSTVATSDVTVENKRVSASLTATTPTAGAEVFAQYDSALARYGFAPSDAPAIGGSTARSYNRGAESVTVTVTPTDGGGSGYTVLALLVASE